MYVVDFNLNYTVQTVRKPNPGVNHIKLIACNWSVTRTALDIPRRDPSQFNSRCERTSGISLDNGLRCRLVKWSSESGNEVPWQSRMRQITQLYFDLAFLPSFYFKSKYLNVFLWFRILTGKNGIHQYSISLLSVWLFVKTNFSQ